MSAEIETFTVACLCRAAKHEFTVSASDIPLKCSMFIEMRKRHTLGTLCYTVVFLPQYYKPSQSILDHLTPFKFSKTVTFFFCSTCGTHVLISFPGEGNDSGTPASWSVASGSLNRIEDVVEVQNHGHIQDTLDGGFADFLPMIKGQPIARWPDLFRKGQELPLGWSSPHRSSTPPSPLEKLHGHCKCNGVEFWISRPSPRSMLAEKYWPEFPPNDVSDQPVPDGTKAFYLRDHGTKFLAGFCACNSCRLAAGTEMAAWAFVPVMDISLSPTQQVPWTKLFGTLKKYESSKGCYRYFCGRCGACVFYDGEGRMFFKDVAVGLLDAPEGARAENWLVWRTRRVGYRDDAIPRAESFVLDVEKGMREWQGRREGEDLSGGSQSGGAL